MPNPIDSHCGRQMRAARERRGISQKELAKLLGISFQQVQKYESSTNRISASKMWQMCAALDLTPGYFFAGLEKQRRPAMPERPEDGRTRRQTLDMNKAFERVSDGGVRRQVVHLVKALAEVEEART